MFLNEESWKAYAEQQANQLAEIKDLVVTLSDRLSQSQDHIRCLEYELSLTRSGLANASTVMRIQAREAGRLEERVMHAGAEIAMARQEAKEGIVWIKTRETRLRLGRCTAKTLREWRKSGLIPEGAYKVASARMILYRKSWVESHAAPNARLSRMSMC